LAPNEAVGPKIARRSEVWAPIDTRIVEPHPPAPVSLTDKPMAQQGLLSDVQPASPASRLTITSPKNWRAGRGRRYVRGRSRPAALPALLETCRADRVGKKFRGAWGFKVAASVARRAISSNLTLARRRGGRLTKMGRPIYRVAQHKLASGCPSPSLPTMTRSRVENRFGDRGINCRLARSRPRSL
jgi:hypothetical protein